MEILELIVRILGLFSIGIIVIAAWLVDVGDNEGI